MADARLVVQGTGISKHRSVTRLRSQGESSTAKRSAYLGCALTALNVGIVKVGMHCS